MLSGRLLNSKLSQEVLWTTSETYQYGNNWMLLCLLTSITQAHLCLFLNKSRYSYRYAPSTQLESICMRLELRLVWAKMSKTTWIPENEEMQRSMCEFVNRHSLHIKDEKPHNTTTRQRYATVDYPAPPHLTSPLKTPAKIDICIAAQSQLVSA
jgi:hypothetical protein